VQVEVRHKTNTAAYRQGTTYFTKKIKVSPHTAHTTRHMHAAHAGC
jgi:hypothetical protein